MPAKHQCKPCDIKKILKNYEAGQTLQQIADESGLSTSTIGRRLKVHQVLTRQRKYQLDENLLNEIDTDWKAYLLGLAFADGNVRQVTKGYSFKINLHEKDKEILEYLCQKIYGSLESLKYKPAKVYHGKDGKIRHNSAQWMLSIHSKKVVESLLKYGCQPAKSLTLVWPTNLPLDMYRHFLRGYFDGDGWVQHQEVGFISSRSFCKGLQEFLFNVLEIESHLTLAHKIARVRIHKQSDIKRLFDVLYEDSSVHLARKYRRFQEVLDI